MSTQSVRSVLRIVAVVTMLVGGITTSTTIISAFAAAWSADYQDFRSTVARLSIASVFGCLAVVAWGLALFHFSDAIAQRVTSDPQPSSELSRRRAP